MRRCMCWPGCPGLKIQHPSRCRNARLSEDFHMSDDAKYCWCGTRLVSVWLDIGVGKRAFHCSAHGYQDCTYGPTPPAPTIPWA